MKKSFMSLLTAALFLPLVAFLPTASQAEIMPAGGRYDKRIRSVNYNPVNVTRITTAYGVSSSIIFDAGEVINDVAIGDNAAWKAVPRGNILFIKPIQEHASTNATIVTDKRIYHFTWVVLGGEVSKNAFANRNLTFSLQFKYPDQAAAEKNAAYQAEAMSMLLDEGLSNGLNYDYWVAGSESISPTQAYDDNRFMYLSFGRNRDIPAIYEVGKDGEESLINTHVINGNTVVVQRVLPKLMLRRGNQVAAVVNRSYDVNGGIDNKTGTASPYVERVVKGAN